MFPLKKQPAAQKHFQKDFENSDLLSKDIYILQPKVTCDKKLRISQYKLLQQAPQIWNNHNTSLIFLHN